MSKYKKGAFLNVLNFNPTEWEAQLRQIKNLPSRQHIEVWLEYIPTKDELQILRGMLEETEVIVHGPFIHMSLVTHLNELADVSWRRCYDAVDVATLIGAKVITFHAGTYA
ncbi:MAG: hypothetical protein ACREBU_16525, partial [Nitrososphaera sp.]